MRVSVIAVSVGLSAAVALGAPLHLDAADLRAEVAVRRAVYGEAPSGSWASQARVLDGVLRALDTSSRSLGEDLETIARSARLLDRAFGEDLLLSMRIAEILDGGDALVAGTLDALAGAVDAAPADRSSRRAAGALESARRCLERARSSVSPETRARLLGRAFAKVQAARAALGMAPPRAEASATVAGQYLATTEFLAAEGGAVVTVDGDGAPTGLLLRFRRAAPGGPASAHLEIRLDSGFTGIGTWPTPDGLYDHTGLNGPLVWEFPLYELATNFLTITEYDPVEGRIAGTFQLEAIWSIYRMPLSMTEGVFEVSGALFRGP